MENVSEVMIVIKNEGQGVQDGICLETGALRRKQEAELEVGEMKMLGSQWEIGSSP